MSQVRIHQYKKPFGRDESEHLKWESAIQMFLRNRCFKVSNELVEFYRFNATQHRINSGESRRIVVVENATDAGAPEEHTVFEEGQVINGVQTNFTTFLKPNEEISSFTVYSEEGLPLIQYIHDTSVANILFPLFDEYSDTNIKLFELLFTELVDSVQEETSKLKSWVRTANKDKLIEQIRDGMVRTYRERTDRNRERLANAKHKIQEYKQSITNLWRDVIRLEKVLASEDTIVDDVQTKIIEHLDLIAQLDKVSDVQIEGERINVFTNDLYMYSDKGIRYYLGKMRISILTRETLVQFTNLNNPRRSHWTYEDPHPHVSGASTNACFGSLDVTIAELCGQEELYPLVLMAIDFLENANTADSAGRNVVNWDEVDEEGNVIKTANGDDDEHFNCDRCDERTHHDDGTTVYDRIDEDGDPVDDRYVCNECREEYYYYSDHFEEYVRNSIDEEDYMEDEDEEEGV